MPHTNTPTIRAADLRLALHSAKLRSSTQGRTALLAATTAAPVVNANCGQRGAVLRIAQASGNAACNVAPMQRGHLARLIARVSVEQGGREVRATWGATMKTLLAEPRYVLNGGAA